MLIRSAVQYENVKKIESTSELVLKDANEERPLRNINPENIDFFDNLMKVLEDNFQSRRAHVVVDGAEIRHVHY